MSDLFILFLYVFTVYAGVKLLQWWDNRNDKVIQKRKDKLYEDECYHYIRSTLHLKEVFRKALKDEMFCTKKPYTTAYNNYYKYIDYEKHYRSTEETK